MNSFNTLLIDPYSPFNFTLLNDSTTYPLHGASMAVYGFDDPSTNCINENNETIDTTSTNHNSVLDDMIFVPLRNKATDEHMNIIDDIPSK